MMRPAVAEQFSGISRLAQAVLSYATLACIQSRTGDVDPTAIKAELGLSEEEWESAFSELYTGKLAWIIDYPHRRLQTRPAFSICLFSDGAPTNRPKKSEWDALKAFYISYYHSKTLPPSCIYCETEEAPFELDHLVPLSKGGSNHFLNLHLACRTCNRTKRDKLPDEWARYRGARPAEPSSDGGRE